MATTRSVPFEELTRLASDFVTSQKGMWDHKDWIDFLSHVQQQGIEVSDEMHAKLGELLEAMKEYHAAVSSTEDVGKAVSTVFNESAAFIKRQKGVWGHAEWEDFVKTIQQIAELRLSFFGNIDALLLNTREKIHPGRVVPHAFL